MLESFNASPQLAERPLTTIERLIEEQSIEQIVRRRYGLSEQQPLRTQYNAYRDFTRAVFRLDEETRYDLARMSVRPPIERARDFFSQIIIDDVDVRGEVLEDVTVTDRPYVIGELNRCLEITTNEEHFYTNGESIVTFAEAAGYLNSPTLSMPRAISAALVSDMALRVFDTANAHHDYADILEELLTHQANALTEKMGRLAVADFRSGSFNSLATLLIAPTEADMELDAACVVVPQMPSIDQSDYMVSRKK